jgi:hypothetical protein
MRDSKEITIDFEAPGPRRRLRLFDAFLGVLLVGVLVTQIVILRAQKPVSECTTAAVAAPAVAPVLAPAPVAPRPVQAVAPVQVRHAKAPPRHARVQLRRTKKVSWRPHDRKRLVKHAGIRGPKYDDTEDEFVQELQPGEPTEDI